MGTFGHGFEGRFGRKCGLGMYSCFHYIISWLPLYSSPLGTPLLTISFRVGTTWEIPILVVFPLPNTIYITPLHSFQPHLSLFPFGSTRVSLPLPLSTPLIRPRMMPWRLMQLKGKIKAYLATFNKKMYNKMQKMVETKTFST